MKLHTSLTEAQVRKALADAQYEGDVPADVEFDILSPVGSRSHANAFEVHLSTQRNDTRDDGRKRKRAAFGGYAATHDEWGFFFAQLFDTDPDAKAGPYDGIADFHRKTRGAYE